MQEQTIFTEALEREDPAERAAFLEGVCAGDSRLRQRIERLLGQHDHAGSFLEQPVMSGDATAYHQPPISEQPGTVIGPYKLLQQIGEGGMGVVFMAEQAEPIQRTVALKIIKPGIDTRQVIARFEAERQAVAMMDHPNIAKVLDAGTTDSGWPYFVMELVKGVPITKYCDEKHLLLRARLELFVQVCQAVQHAHQKGIIHRDIKPNNILVAEYDDHAISKVIDFGVAKATAQRLTERTMFTEFGQIVGTLEYMSPEQAKLNQLDVDTRSDVYSLGVLLYELLTGSTPFEPKRLQQAAFDEMLRIIREEEPPKPSTRLSTANELHSIAANRGLEPLKLNRSVQGELDWIVMKALEKDRNRRYESASAFAAEIGHHLSDEPVQACPPSAQYRLGKFIRRNKTALAVAAIILFFLSVLGGGVGWAIRNHAARQARVSGQLELILDEVARLETDEKWTEALASARRAEPMLVGGDAPTDIRDRARGALADLEFVRRLDDIRAQSGTAYRVQTLAVRADRDYTAAFRDAGIDVDSLPINESVSRITARRQIASALLPILNDWVAARSYAGDEAAVGRLIEVVEAADPDPWRLRVREALADRDWETLEDLATSPELGQQSAATFNFLISVLSLTGKKGEHVPILRAAQWKYPSDYWINICLGVTLIWRHSPSDIRDGIGFMQAAVALRPESGHAIMNLGNGYLHLGRFDQAIACYRRALALWPSDSSCYVNLSIALGEQGLHDEAIAALEQARKLRPPDDPSTYGNLAWLLANSIDVKRRDPDKAVELANRAAELSPNSSFYLTALGVAQYRAGDWHRAVAALKKSDELPPSRSIECINALFLAMAHWQLVELAESRRYYGRAIEWMETQQTEEAELLRFRAEAEKLLEIADEAPTNQRE